MSNLPLSQEERTAIVEDYRRAIRDHSAHSQLASNAIERVANIFRTLTSTGLLPPSPPRARQLSAANPPPPTSLSPVQRLVTNLLKLGVTPETIESAISSGSALPT